jgi:hypothetical protein
MPEGESPSGNQKRSQSGFLNWVVYPKSRNMGLVVFLPYKDKRA